MLPSGRTIKALKADGFVTGVVERKLPHCFITVDLFGFIDIVAMKPDLPGLLAVQATSDNGGNVSARLQKILSDPIVVPNARLWLENGNRIEVWGWGLKGARGQRKLWVARKFLISLGGRDADDNRILTAAIIAQV